MLEGGFKRMRHHFWRPHSDVTMWGMCFQLAYYQGTGIGHKL